MIANLYVKKKKGGRVVIMISGGLDKTDIDFCKREGTMPGKPSFSSEIIIYGIVFP